ncbi:MAG: repair protein RadC [Deferribacteraceae bacterium]|jgi:DNA repair protein RadC|nr:repair protein RadC [Deferribacteraceae bacterium]
MEKHYLGHRKRLKERFLSNPDSLQDYEILELLLGYVVRGKDTKPYAKELIKVCGGLNNIFSYDIGSIKGLGFETETFFKLLKEFLFRIERGVVKDKKEILNSPESVFDFLKYKIGYENKEKFVVILLNSKGELLEYKIFDTGTVNQAVVFVREVAEFAVKGGAVSAIVAHNHPSGVLKFSNSDYDLTIKIKSGLEILEIILQDHILVCKDTYLSMRQFDDKRLWR